PAHGRARLLEVHAHDDFERAFEALALLAQATRVLQRRLRIVNRAGTDDDREPIVAAAQDSLQSATRSAHGRRSMLAKRILAHELFGRAQLADVADAQVVGTNVHGQKNRNKKNRQEVWRFFRVSYECLLQFERNGSASSWAGS